MGGEGERVRGQDSWRKWCISGWGTESVGAGGFLSPNAFLGESLTGAGHQRLSPDGTPSESRRQTQKQARAHAPPGESLGGDSSTFLPSFTLDACPLPFITPTCFPGTGEGRQSDAVLGW